MIRIDMHTHTTASDGIMNAMELVRYAKQKQLAGIAITDHDTTDALDEAYEILKHDQDMWFLPGIEFSTEEGNTEVHVLAYGLDYHDHSLKRLLVKLRNARVERAKKMVIKLNELGIAITFEQVKEYAKKGIVGRVHIARALVNYGFTVSVKQAFDQWIGKTAPAYVPRFKLKPLETIHMIHDLGGVSVLAHPALMKNDPLVDQLIRNSLMGIEVFYPAHRPEDTCRYYRKALDNQLLITGGSDFHAPPSKKVRESDLGQCAVPLEPVKSFFKSRIRIHE